MSKSLIRMSKLTVKTGLGKSAIYQKISEGTFPAPVKLTERAVGWIESEVDEWIEQRIAERDNHKEVA